MLFRRAKEGEDEWMAEEGHSTKSGGGKKQQRVAFVKVFQGKEMSTCAQKENHVFS